MSILKKTQSESVGEMAPRTPAPESKNRFSLDGSAVIDPKSLEKQWDSLESGIGSLPTITSNLNPDSAGGSSFHVVGLSAEPQDELNVSPNSSIAASNDFWGSNGPREAETSMGCKAPETHESFDDFLVQHRGSERSPSNVSELSLAGTEGSYSVRSSIDSAICMDNQVTKRTTRASLATNRISIYSVISTETIQEMPDSPLDIEEGNSVVADVKAEELVSNLQFTFSSRLQANEEADKPKTSRIVKLVRFLLRIASTCLRTPQVRSESESLSFDYERPDDDRLRAPTLVHIKDEYAIDNVAFTKHDEAEENNETVLADNNTGIISERKTASHEFTLEKKEFLKSFELLLEHAKAQNIDVVGKNFQIANFAAAILDCHGGCLSIDDLDVHLYVPPGAIPNGKQQHVYISATATSSVDNRSFSTPFVHCGPPDTTFEEDVVLTMPHCVKDTSSCKFSMSKLSSGGSSELSEGLDVITVVDNDSITFSVNHFCGFGATASPVDGAILQKSMIACVFISENSHSDDEVALRLRLVDNVKVDLLEVERKEKTYGFHLADMESPLVVRKIDKDVVTKISNCSESWEISEPTSCQRKFQCELLWRETTASCAQAFPSVMFFAKRCSSSKNVCFKARLTVYQEGGESCNYGVTFLVDAKQRVCQPHVPVQEPQLEKTQPLLWDQLRKNRVTRSRLLEEHTFGELCSLLDTPHPLDKDWTRLLIILLNTGSGCSQNVESIRAKAGRERCSPTKIVLDLFFGKQSGKKKEDTMDILKSALSNFNRPDIQFAINAIEGQVKKWSETRKDSFPLTPEILVTEVTTDKNANLETGDIVTQTPLDRKDSAYNSGVGKVDIEALQEKLNKDEFQVTCPPKTPTW